MFIQTQNVFHQSFVMQTIETFGKKSVKSIDIRNQNNFD